MAKVSNFEVKVGATVEAWLLNDGKPFSASNISPNNKTALKIEITPASTLEGWNNNIQSAVQAAKAYGYDLSFEPVMKFGKVALKKLPEKATAINNSYWNAHEKMHVMAEAPDLNYRTAGGYVNVYWKDIVNKAWPDSADPTDASHLNACYNFAAILDAYLGLPAVFWDHDNDRRKYFGQAGRFVPKSYGEGWFGLQYQTLSNRWMNFPQAQDLIFGNVIEAFEKAMSDYTLNKKKYLGREASYFIEKAHLPATETELVNLIAANSPIKGAGWYRKQREQNKAA